MNFFLFGIYPYIALAIFLVGTVLRFRFDPYGWTAQSSQFLEGKGFRVISNLFHVSIILLFCTHVLGLLTPAWLYGVLISHETKQLLAIFVGGFFGLLCFIATTLLVVRRVFCSRIRKNSQVADLAMMLLLYATLLVGESSLYFSYQHVKSDNLFELASWAQHLVTFQKDASLFMENKHLIFKLHVFLGVTLFLVFPFTRLVHILSAPVGYIFRNKR